MTILVTKIENSRYRKMLVLPQQNDTFCKKNPRLGARQADQRTGVYFPESVPRPHRMVVFAINILKILQTDFRRKLKIDAPRIPSKNPKSFNFAKDAPLWAPKRGPI